MTSPLFILSSGRSGSQMMQKLFSGLDDLEVHHEYLCNIIQPLGTKYSMNIINKEDVNDVINSTYKASINLSNKKIWIDSSNKLTWILDQIIVNFPNAKYVHIIRDGRRVTSSYFNKLHNECYDDTSIKIFYDFYRKQSLENMPPPEKKYWWPFFKNDGSYDNFFKLSQFEKIVTHWVESNKKIYQDLKSVDKNNVFFIKLEDLVSKESKFEEFINFCGVDYHSINFDILKKPHNVHVPKSFDLDATQNKQFWNISRDIMNDYGYDSKTDYKVNY